MPRVQFSERAKRYHITIPKEIVIQRKIEIGDLISFNLVGQEDEILLKITYKEKEWKPE